MSDVLRDLDGNPCSAQDLQILADKVRCCNCNQDFPAEKVPLASPGSFWRCKCRNVTIIFHGDFAECWVVDGVLFDYFQDESRQQNWLIRLPQEEADILDCFEDADDAENAEITVSTDITDSTDDNKPR